MTETIATRHALLGAPPEYLTPLDRPTLPEAQVWCRNLATTHYRNFHVATFFLPHMVRPHFDAVYAYCRVADDLGDEVTDRAVAARLLDTWGSMLEECYDTPEKSMHPAFVALRETIRESNPPRQLFLDLLHASRINLYKTQYESWDELLEYLRYAANPLGRLVLSVSGYNDEALGLLSDKAWTALQLADLWQNVVEDAERGRRYLPAESLHRFGVDEGQIVGRVFTPEFRGMMQELVARTRAMLLEGAEVSLYVDKELKVVLDLLRRSGEAILDGITKQNFDVLRGRPVVSRAKRAGLLMEAFVGKLRTGMAA